MTEPVVDVIQGNEEGVRLIKLKDFRGYPVAISLIPLLPSLVV